MSGWSTVTPQRRARLALEVSLIADNARVLAQQLEKVAKDTPEADPSTLLELEAAAHLVRTVEHSLDAKAASLADSLHPGVLS